MKTWQNNSFLGSARGEIGLDKILWTINIHVSSCLDQLNENINFVISKLDLLLKTEDGTSNLNRNKY